MGKAKLKAFWASSRKLAVVLVLLFVAGGAGVTRILGSGGGECDYVNCYSFFDPKIILHPEEVSPQFLSRYGTSTQPKEIEVINLEEWSSYFGNAIPRELLSSLIYKIPAEDVLDYGLREAFTKYGQRDRVARSLEYLVLAKAVEPIATRKETTEWRTTKAAPPVDPESVQELINTAERSISRVDRFLGQRYRFQVLRLMYYSGQYARAQQYFETHKGRFTEENSPKYRFMDLAAGAYYKDKKYGKANYLYSRVFDKFEPLKSSAYFSFHPMEDRDWKETLSLARDAREREVLWQLLGIYADGMAAIEGIYQINPKSKLLPLLLVREVNQAERAWTANQSRFRNGGGDGNGPRPDAVVVGASRVAKIQAIADKGNAYKPYLWSLAVGHLFALAGDSRTAEKYVDLAQKAMPNDPEIRAQARMSRLFARVRAIQSIDKAAEPYLAQEHDWLRQYASPPTNLAGNLNAWTLKHLSEVYAKGADPLRALMLTDSPQHSTYQSIAGIDSILAFMRTPSNAFDRMLVANYKYSAEELQELRALHYLYAGDLERAVETFKLPNVAPKSDLNADPFTIHIRDCHDCDQNAPHTKYSKLTFAERMLTLSRAAQGQGEAAATASFELANGFYNMSYYGNGRDIYDTARGNLRPRQPDRGLAGLAINMDLAEKYYVQAFTLSSNKEFQAKAVFMAAKVEQTRALPPETYFSQLRSLADTQYYQEIIRECARFRFYLGL